MTRTARQCLEATIRIECLAQELYAGLAVTFGQQDARHRTFIQNALGKVAA